MDAEIKITTTWIFLAHFNRVWPIIGIMVTAVSGSEPLCTIIGSLSPFVDGPSRIVYDLKGNLNNNKFEL